MKSVYGRATYVIYWEKVCKKYRHAQVFFWTVVYGHAGRLSVS